jgi:hypothetical protein
LTEAFDCGEDFVGGFDRFEWLWVVIVTLDEGADIGLKLDD